METIKMKVHTKDGTYVKVIAPNNPKGYTKKDLELAEKWSSLLNKVGVSTKVYVETTS